MKGLREGCLLCVRGRTNYGEGQFFAGPEHGDEAHGQSIC